MTFSLGLRCLGFLLTHDLGLYVSHLSNVAACGRDAVVDAAKYVGGRLTAPVGGEGDHTVEEGKRDAREGVDKAKAHGHRLVDRAREAYGDAKHSMSESVEDAKNRVSETAEEAKQRAREAAERARPHTAEVCWPSVFGCSPDPFPQQPFPDLLRVAATDCTCCKVRVAIAGSMLFSPVFLTACTTGCV